MPSQPALTSPGGEPFNTAGDPVSTCTSATSFEGTTEATQGPATTSSAVHLHPHRYPSHPSAIERQTSEGVAEYYADPTGAGLAEAVPREPSVDDEVVGEGEGAAEGTDRVGMGTSVNGGTKGTDRALEEGTAIANGATSIQDEKAATASRGGKLDWDSPSDPDNPRNWSTRKKWASAAVTSFYTFVAPLASSMMVRLSACGGKGVGADGRHGWGGWDE